jgi:hypothetical protein
VFFERGVLDRHADLYHAINRLALEVLNVRHDIRNESLSYLSRFPSPGARASSWQNNLFTLLQNDALTIAKESTCFLDMHDGIWFDTTLKKDVMPSSIKVKTNIVAVRK